MLTAARVVNLVRLQVHHTEQAPVCSTFAVMQHVAWVHKRQLVLVRRNITYIPTDIRLCSTLPTFKRHLKMYLIQIAFTLHSGHPPRLATACASDSACLLTLCTLQMLVLLGRIAVLRT